ncbi:reverse transcriptase domain-containing protein [Tanacetum coccineum]
MREFVIAQKTTNDFVKNQFYNLKTKVEQGQKNHQAAIQDLETKFGRISDQQSSRPTGTLPSNTQTNPKSSTSNEKPYRPPPTRNEHVNAIFTHSGKTYNPPANPNTKTTIFLDDSDDEAEEVEKEAEPLPKKPTQTDTSPLKAHKQKNPYPQRLNKEKMEARYAKFLDMIKEVRINIPLVDVLVGMPNYGKFLKDLVSNKIEYLAVADLGASINLMSYSLYAALSETTLKPTRMSIRLANHTYQYPMGVTENMLVQVGKFVFPVDFVILQMEEDDRVPLLLGRPFLHTAAIIRVKNKELNLGIREDKATFHIDKAMHHPYVNDDTCFRMDVIDEITEDELDALLDDSKPFLNTSEKISETSLDKEFNKFMSRNVQEDKVKDDFEELPPKDELRIRTSIQDPPTDLELKPLPKHLEYVFLEENSLLPIVISALLEQDEKEQLVSVLKNHKEAFTWETSNIPGISPSFCKHKINFEDDVKPFIQRQRRLNPNMKEVVKKDIIKLLDAGIIYATEDSPWEKTTFTCPYGTYAYKRMPFGLCNAPATFQRCMIAIFQDMLETSMEVFMEDFSVFGDSFNSCLNNLEQMLIRCKQAHLVLNWEKCYFVVTEGIVLGQKVSRKGLEVDKAKIDVIAKLPPPTNVKAVRKLKHYFWDEPYLFKACPDGMIRRCVHGSETQKILDECHHGPTGGHYGPSITAKKVFDGRFYWPTIFKEAQTLVQNCDACQRSGSISRRDEMPLNSIHPIKLQLVPLRTDFFMEKRAICCLKSNIVLTRPCEAAILILRVRKEFKVKDKVLLYNSKYKFKAPKLRSKWYGPFIVKHGYPSGYVELYDKHGGSFIVNGHRVKLYHDEEQLNELTIEEINLMCKDERMKAIPFMAPFPANYRETMPWASEKPYFYSVVENTCNEAKLDDLDKTGKGIMIENILNLPSEGSSLEKK